VGCGTRGRWYKNCYITTADIIAGDVNAFLQQIVGDGGSDQIREISDEEVDLGSGIGGVGYVVEVAVVGVGNVVVQENGSNVDD